MLIDKESYYILKLVLSTRIGKEFYPDIYKSPHGCTLQIVVTDYFEAMLKVLPPVDSDIIQNLKQCQSVY
ncbi:MAG: hypothetical protein A2V66_16735 [Ignavibacteria bacterium RBG_13_36_8]|nr:MAG: hypothetical protein A2V66_16735 [Ignavibacteria bacterium RBG_13_36_8]